MVQQFKFYILWNIFVKIFISKGSHFIHLAGNLFVSFEAMATFWLSKGITCRSWFSESPDVVIHTFTSNLDIYEGFIIICIHMTDSHLLHIAVFSTTLLKRVEGLANKFMWINYSNILNLSSCHTNSLMITLSTTYYMENPRILTLMCHGSTIIWGTKRCRHHNEQV